MKTDPLPALPEIINRQRKIKIDRDALARFAVEAMHAVAETDGRPYAVALISDAEMRKLNREFRGKDSPTDVLSFPYHPGDMPASEEAYLGDVAVSLETASRQAAENGLSLECEVKQLILHGVLHLCGFDHETDSGEMARYELKLRRKLGI